MHCSQRDYSSGPARLKLSPASSLGIQAGDAHGQAFDIKWTWSRSSRGTRPPGAKLAFERPGFAVRRERFAEPVERVAGDRGEAPTGRRAIGTDPHLDNILAAPTANLFFVMISRRVPPGDAPGFYHGV